MSTQMIFRPTKRLRTHLFGRVVSAAIVGCALTQVSMSVAQEEHSVDSARSQYRKAFEAVQAKNWQEAHDLLIDLWSRSRTYDVAGLLGEVERKQGREAAAAQYYAFVLENLPPREKADTVEQTQRALRVMKERVATIRFEVLPKSAEVRVDGAPVDFSPLPAEVYVEPGQRVFAAVLGDQRAVERLEVTPGGEYRVVLHVQAPETLPAAEVVSEPFSAPVAVQPVDRGGSGRSLVPVYVGAGLTAVGLGAWIGFGLDARAARSDADAHRQELGRRDCEVGSTTGDTCADARDSFERQRRSALLGNVGMGVAATAGVATLAYLLFWPEPQEPSTGISWRPVLAGDRDGGRVGVFGAF